MTTLDWIIVAFTVLMAVWGYGQGLIAGGLSLVGFAAGAFIGSRLGPLLLEDGSHSPYAPLSALLGAVLIGGLLASGFELLGFHLRSRLGERIGLLDGVGGGVLVACLGLFLVWIGGAVALQTPGARDLREPIQRSAILKELNEVLPPSGPILQALARFDPFPSITGPSANVGPPDPKIARDPDVAAARRSVVRVLGTACGLGVQGSGWVAGRGIVVTNAHVVAGQDDTTVQVGGEGAGLDADAIWFDPHNDLSILRVSGLSGVPALRMNANAEPGTAGAVLGFPENGPYTWRRQGSAARPRSSRRMRTGAGRWSERSRLCAAWCGRATPAGRRSTAPGAWWPRSSRPLPGVSRPGTASPTRSCATRCSEHADPWTRGRARGSRYNFPGARRRSDRAVLCRCRARRAGERPGEAAPRWARTPASARAPSGCAVRTS